LDSILEWIVINSERDGILWQAGVAFLLLLGFTALVGVVNWARDITNTLDRMQESLENIEGGLNEIVEQFPDAQARAAERKIYE
jgi:hypothetical protein